MDIKTIEGLADWSQATEINTKYGPKMLRKAKPTDAFSSAWKQHKDEMKALGASWSKDDRTGQWSLCWWLPISDDELQRRAESVNASRATAASVDLPHPEGLDYMPFQKAGIQYALDRPGVLIGDEMGLGKTIQAIGIINADPSVKSVIVICPKSLKLNWKRELEKWLVKPLSVGIANGAWPNTDIVILNYESLEKNSAYIYNREWSICIVDEAHFIKNSKTKRSQFVKSIKSVRKVRLTGTPIVNRPAELYNIIEDLGGTWGTFFQFAKRYCNAHNNGWGWDYSGAANLDELQRRLRETILVRRLKADVLTELPRKIRQIVEVEADNASAKHAVSAEQSYEIASEERLFDLRAAVELSKAESEEAYKLAVSRLHDAQQVDFTEMSRLRHETAVSKVPAVIAHIENALEDNDQKIIIAAHHRDVISMLADGLAQFHPVVLTGENNEQERQASVDAFQNNPETRIFIGSITAAGVGITLTASSHVIFAELDWVPGNITQMEDRAHRIGQTETVLVQHIVLQDSMDARMANILVEKQKTIDSALDINHPARIAPIYQPRKAAATSSETVDGLTKLAEKLSSAQKEAAHSALRQLSLFDLDHASDLNGIGFNRIDTRIGHELAAKPELTPKQAALAWKIAVKYHRQLDSDTANLLKDKS